MARPIYFPCYSDNHIARRNGLAYLNKRKEIWPIYTLTLQIGIPFLCSMTRMVGDPYLIFQLGEWSAYLFFL